MPAPFNFAAALVNCTGGVVVTVPFAGGLLVPLAVGRTMEVGATEVEITGGGGTALDVATVVERDSEADIWVEDEILAEDDILVEDEETKVLDALTREIVSE